MSYLISATWWTYRFMYIPEYFQYWFQNSVLNLITTRGEFTLLQYSKTLSSIIASFCIIFDICNMMNQQYYIYSRILPVLISTCWIEFNHYKTWIYSLLYSTTLSSIIASFCVIFDICYMMNQQFYIYIPEYSKLVSACCIEFNHYKTRIHCIRVFYCTLNRNYIILYHIWYLLHDEPAVLYIFQYTPSIDFKMLKWI